eukprot:233596-Rhodomonas_salina.2
MHTGTHTHTHARARAQLAPLAAAHGVRTTPGAPPPTLVPASHPGRVGLSSQWVRAKEAVDEAEIGTA